MKLKKRLSVLLVAILTIVITVPLFAFASSENNYITRTDSDIIEQLIEQAILKGITENPELISIVPFSGSQKNAIECCKSKFIPYGEMSLTKIDFTSLVAFDEFIEATQELGMTVSIHPNNEYNSELLDAIDSFELNTELEPYSILCIFGCNHVPTGGLLIGIPFSWAGLYYCEKGPLWQATMCTRCGRSGPLYRWGDWHLEHNWVQFGSSIWCSTCGVIINF
ncbi:MAG: hypothetical protein FWF81_11095 [Defluviitaleaceae bacterium]|nr:hypothetical protein [Defluviitaleaceae bacterium]